MVGMARPLAVCGHSAGGKPLSVVQPSNDRRRHTLMKWFHIQPLLLCVLLLFFIFSSPALMFLPQFAVIILLFFFCLCFIFHAPSPFFLSILTVPLYLISLLALCLSLSLSLEGDQECRVVTRKSSIWVERDEWCRMVKFNTYLDYSYRFCVVWDVVPFSLLVPLIHILWLNILIFTGQNMVLKCPIRYST